MIIQPQILDMKMQIHSISCYYYFRQYSPKYTIVFDRMERFQEERFTIDLNINDSLSKIEKLCYILKSTNPVVINIF